MPDVPARGGYRSRCQLPLATAVQYFLLLVLKSGQKKSALQPRRWPPKYFQAVSSRKNLFPFLIMCHDFRSNRNQLTVFNRIDDVTELLKIFIVVGCQENCFPLGF